MQIKKRLNHNRFILFKSNEQKKIIFNHVLIHDYLFMCHLFSR